MNLFPLGQVVVVCPPLPFKKKATLSAGALWAIKLVYGSFFGYYMSFRAPTPSNSSSFRGGGRTTTTTLAPSCSCFPAPPFRKNSQIVVVRPPPPPKKTGELVVVRAGGGGGGAEPSRPLNESAGAFATTQLLYGNLFRD